MQELFARILWPASGGLDVLKPVLLAGTCEMFEMGITEWVLYRDGLRRMSAVSLMAAMRSVLRAMAPQGTSSRGIGAPGVSQQQPMSAASLVSHAPLGPLRVPMAPTGGAGLARPLSPRLQGARAVGTLQPLNWPDGKPGGGLRLRAGTAVLAPLSPLDVLDRALGGGVIGGGGGLAALLDQIVDLLSWVDFTSADDIRAGQGAKQKP